MFNKIGIIGGTGTMGKMFSFAISNLGYNISVSDETSLAQEKEIISSADLIILSVPIDATLKVIKRIGPKLKSNQLLVDFTSVKEQVVPAMLKYSAQVIPTHPMFGEMEDISGQNVVLMPMMRSKQFHALDQLFKRLGLKTVILKSWQEHDRMMSFIQGLMHFMHIVFVRSLYYEGADVQTLMQLASPVYRANFAFACRIISRDPNLYSHILLDNKHNSKVLDHFITQASQTLKSIKNNKVDDLNNLISKMNLYLGPIAGEFSNESDFLIQQMTEYQSKKSK